MIHTRSIAALLIAACAPLVHAQSPNWLWAQSDLGHQYAQASTVATDGAGNVIVAGYFAGDSVAFGNVVVHNNTSGFDDLFLVKYDANGNVLWAQGAGGSMDDKAFAVRTDASGNIYLTGDFYSPSITFGTYTFTNAGNVADVFVVKYDPTGAVLWGTREGGPGVEIPYALAVGADGSIVVAGRFSSNSITIGDTTLTQAGSMDVFVVKYTASGDVLWANGAGGGSNDEAYALALTNAGDVIVAGYFSQVATFGTFTLPDPGSANIFLARCDGATGAFTWASGVGGNGDERALAVAVDDADNSYVSGFFQSDSLPFGTTTLHSTALDNGFIARFDGSGDPVWAQALPGDSRATGIVVRNNALFACGKFQQGPFDYGASSLPLDGTTDPFLLGSDLDGNALWAAKQTAGGTSTDVANALAVDDNGHLAIAGMFSSNDLSFGATQLTNAGGFDMFVARTGAVNAGIEALRADVGIHLFPNPTSGTTTVEARSPLRMVEVHDAAGALVLRMDVVPAQTRVQLPPLTSGFYQVCVFTPAARWVGKLVVR